MECIEITQNAVAMQILQSPADKRLAALFRCIYALFHDGFLNWILHKYTCSDKDKLREDAKDAFQNGLLAFYRKTQAKSFFLQGSLKSCIYSFGLLQLLALFKTEKRIHPQQYYLQSLALFLEDDLLSAERHHLLNEKELELMKALSHLPKKQQAILMMRYFEGLKSKQIAERLGVSAGNVDNDAAKAYKALRKILSAKHSFKETEKWD